MYQVLAITADQRQNNTFRQRQEVYDTHHGFLRELQTMSEGLCSVMCRSSGEIVAFLRLLTAFLGSRAFNSATT